MALIRLTQATARLAAIYPQPYHRVLRAAQEAAIPAIFDNGRWFVEESDVSVIAE